MNRALKVNVKFYSRRVEVSVILHSNGSSGWVKGGGEHEIYAATFRGHLFYDLFLQGRGGGGMAPSAPSAPLDPLLGKIRSFYSVL